MKKFLCILFALTMLVSLLAGCGNTASDTEDAANADSTATEAPDTTEEKPEGWWKEELTTVTDGVLTVATSPDFAPYEFYAIDEEGNAQLAGFDMALAQYVADYLGLTLEVVPMDFDGVLAEVTAGNVDLGMAGLSPDPARMDAMDFSDIYYQGGQSLVSVQANKDKWASLEELNDSSLTIGAQLGSIQYDLAMENTPDADIVQLAKVTDVVSELLGGKLDAGFIETVVAQSYAKNYPDLCILFDVPYEVEGSSIGVVKGNEALLAGVNEAIAAALADGSLDTFVAEANELASGETYEGLLEDDAAAADTAAEGADAAAEESTDAAA